MDISGHVVYLVQSGLGNLGAYLAAHVLLCLVPAFFIAGGLSALVPKESVTRFLGRNAPKYVAYPAAALAGSVLAVCSCTIVPLFAGIYKKGAGLGPAISLSFGIGIGMIMALIFSKDDIAHAVATDDAFVGQGGLTRKTVIFLLLLVALLIIFGTLKVPLLLNSYARITLPIQGMDRFQEALYRLVPFDATKGEEGISAQGAILIGLLALIALTAWRGLSRVHEGYNRWTWAALVLVALTLVVAAARMEPEAHGLEVYLTGKMIGVVLVILAIWYMARRYFADHEIQEWLWETWRFVRQIFPLLIVGVFAVGVIRRLIQPAWVQAIAGSNTVIGNLAGVVFGVFMYFPTLVEVPIAKMFLTLGMHRGPLIAYLMADPELSLQSILITAAIIGRKKAWAYVGWVALFSTLSGLMYGSWVDGTSAWLLPLYLTTFIGLLALGFHLIGRRSQRAFATTGAK